VLGSLVVVVGLALLHDAGWRHLRGRVEDRAKLLLCGRLKALESWFCLDRVHFKALPTLAPSLVADILSAIRLGRGKGQLVRRLKQVSVRLSIQALLETGGGWSLLEGDQRLGMLH
jgi:hypothetical protein